VRDEAQDRAAAEVLAALSVGQRLAAGRTEQAVALAPDDQTRQAQRSVAVRERENTDLLEARVRELGTEDLKARYDPFFRAFFEHTEPGDWLEALVFLYVGDSLVKDLTDELSPLLDPVSAAVVRWTLAERDEQDAIALDHITGALAGDGATTERIAIYARRVIGEALTQTRRALDETEAFRSLLGGEDGEKRVLLDLLQRHRARLDRVGIEPVD
jgi:hypothetical protein